MCGVDSYIILSSFSGCCIFCYFKINLILIKPDLIYILIPYFYEIYFNVILLSVPRSSIYFWIFRFLHHIFCASCISQSGSTRESAKNLDLKSKRTHSAENFTTLHRTEQQSSVTSVLPFKKGVYAIAKWKSSKHQTTMSPYFSL